MSRTQRLVFLGVAVVIAVVAIIVLAGRGGDEGGTTTANVTLKAGSVQKIEAKEGDTVSFQVESPDKTQEVHVHGYNLMQDAGPGKPAKFSFKANITGRFEIEFEEAGQQIGELTVNPK